MFLFDTNVVSELRKAGAGKADKAVLAWVADIDAECAFLSVITVLELEMGVLQAEHRDTRKGALLRTWLDDQVLPEFAGRVLPVDMAVAQRCARLHVPDRRSERDALIAATALVYGLTVVTRNVADFAPTGVPIINPWAT
jgi:predicted nucleic acid-binding protein